MEFNFNLEPEEDPFIIDLQKVSKFKPLTRITRTLAIDLMENPYLTVGDFFKGLNDMEVDELSQLCEREDDQAVMELLLLSEMLSRAEGVTSETPEEIGEKLGALRLMAAGVNLARKGLVNAYYNNMTFDSKTYGDKIIFKAKDNIDPEDFM